jgi:hypothetical protein
VAKRYVFGLAIAAPAYFDTTLFQTFGANVDTQGNTDQVSVFEFDAGSLVPVVE